MFRSVRRTSWGDLRTALAALPADAGSVIAYIGDGMSAARLASFAQIGELSADLRNRQVAVNSIALGPQTDLEMLGTLAQQTGGVVLLDGSAGKSQRAVGGAELAAAARVGVAYPSRLSVTDAGPTAGDVQLLPTTALPIRSDRSTIYLGKGRAPEELTLSFQFPEGAKTTPLTFALRNTKPGAANAVLALLWKRAQASGGIIDSLAGESMLATTQDAFADRLAAMVAQGERAVAARDAATGEQIGRTVRSYDPSNARAIALLASVRRLKQESATHEILRQVAPEGRRRRAGREDAPGDSAHSSLPQYRYHGADTPGAAGRTAA